MSVDSKMNETEKKETNYIIAAEYESAIRSIEIQLEVTKQEHKNLKEELFQLVSENQNLTSALDAEYQERIKDVEDNDNFEIFKSEIITNLRSQLDLCKREKEKTFELYKASLKLVEKLEEEISSHKDVFPEAGQYKGLLSPPIVPVLEAKLKSAKEHLEMVMSGREQLESENVRHQTEIAKLKLNVDSNNKLIEQLRIKETEWKSKCKKLEQDYTLLNATYECVVRSRDELERKLENYAVRVQELLHKNHESRNKVEEALDVVEKALAAKDAATMREIQLQEEINKLNLCLEHVIDEAGKKVGTEVEETRKKYETTVKDLLTELTEVQKALEKKKTENRRMSLKFKKLEKMTSAKLDKEKINLIKGSETEITILENNLDSAYQELERFKMKYEELEREKVKLEEEFSELVEKHHNFIKDKETREASFEEIIRELRSQIERKIEDLNEASKRTEFFLSQIRQLQTDNKNMSSQLGNCNCDRLKLKIKKLNETCASQRTELQSHVESQMKLNEIWKEEIRKITEKFEEKIREMKKECSQLKAKNKKMMSELNASRKRTLSLENV